MNWIDSLTTLDIIIIALYFIFIVGVGIKYSKAKNSESYFLLRKVMLKSI